MKSSLSFRLSLVTAACALLLCDFVVIRAAGQYVAPTSPLTPRDQSAKSTAVTTNRCVVRQDERCWWLVAPSGEPFFSLGICMFNQGQHRGEYDQAKPSYAAFRHYDMPEAWASASLARLKSWGFTTIGGWSDYHLVPPAAEHNLWLTPVLHIGSTSGAPWFDMWDEKVLARIGEVARKNIRELRGNPRVLGYYSDNELGWWNAILWKMTLEQPASSGQRQRLVRLVRDTYADDWSALLKDFDPDSAANWQELERGGKLWLRPGSGGIRTMRRFLGLAADRYYQVMRDTIRKLDPDAMYLGDRYQSFYYNEVARASRNYVDVVSTNLNASWNDGTFIRSYLDSLHELTKKPVVVSEFYMAAEQNRSGNPNASGGFPKVATQAERARALSNTLQSLLRLPYVVGADWFQYYDEPPHGRKLDGEDYNFGLVDIHDRPYEEVTAAFSSTKLAELKSQNPVQPVSAVSGVPPAPAEPFANFESMLALRSWDRQRGFVPASSPHPAGDLYIAWSPTALYLAVYVLDIVEPDYYRAAEVPEVDRAEWNIRLLGRDQLSIRVGAGKEPVANDAVRVKSLSGTYHTVRCITALELPAERLGSERLKAGDRIELESSFITHARANRIDWKGTFTLAD